MKTFVLKFRDDLDLRDVLKLYRGYFVPGTKTYEAALQKANQYFYYYLRPANRSDVDKVLNVLKKFNVSLKPLYREPAKITTLMGRVAQQKVNPGKRYRSANFFNYFQITVDDAAAPQLLAAVEPYLLSSSYQPVLYSSKAEMAKAKKAKALQYFYELGNAVPSGICDEQVSASTTATEVNQQFWNDLQIRHFWQTNFLPGAVPDVRIHVLEFGWEANAAFSDPTLSTDQVVMAMPKGPVDASILKHGCSVLGLLFARWAGTTPPATITTGSLNGIAPMANLRLYSVLGADGSQRIRDALMRVQEQANRGDVVLMAMELTNLPFGSELAIPGGNFPMETNPDLFELIQVYTTELGLIVVEAAGNGAVDLSPLPNGSGAILVGAARKTNRTWRNLHNFGRRVDCCLPGFRIRSTYPDRFSTETPVFCKTSAASTLMAGLAAGLQVVARTAGLPPITPDELRRTIRDKYGIAVAERRLNGRVRVPRLNVLAEALLANAPAP